MSEVDEENKDKKGVLLYKICIQVYNICIFNNLASLTFLTSSNYGQRKVKAFPDYTYTEFYVHSFFLFRFL